MKIRDSTKVGESLTLDLSTQSCNQYTTENQWDAVKVTVEHDERHRIFSASNKIVGQWGQAQLGKSEYWVT